jgi:hypothetical protein
MSPLHNGLVWSFLVAVSAALPTFPSALDERTASFSLTPLPPSQDPFDTAHAGYESAALGTILRVRAAPGNLTSVVANCSSAHNILYHTTNSQYNPSWAVTTLFAPASPSHSMPDASGKTRGGSALLSYQYPYNSADVDGQPLVMPSILDLQAILPLSSVAGCTLMCLISRVH